MFIWLTGTNTGDKLLINTDKIEMIEPVKEERSKEEYDTGARSRILYSEPSTGLVNETPIEILEKIMEAK